MKQKTKILIIVCSAVITCGIIFSAAALALGAHTSLYFDGSKIVFENSNNIINRHIKITEPIKNIELDISSAEIKIIAADEFYIDYHLSRDPVINNSHNTLSIKSETKPFIGIILSDIAEQCIEIGIPEAYELNNIKLNCDLGNIFVSDLTAGYISISANSGDVALSGIESKSALKAKLDLGNLNGESISAKKADFKLGAGNSEISKLDSENLSADLDLGNLTLEGSLKGSNKISCNSGDCKLVLDKPISEYSCNIDIGLGRYTVNGQESKTFNTQNSKSQNRIDINIDLGNFAIEY